MGITKLKFRYTENPVAKERKDAEVDEFGRVKQLCLDGKAHSFKQIRASKQNESYIIKVCTLEKRKLLNNKFVHVVTEKGSYYTRVFCSKCTISTLILLKEAQEEI